MIWGDSFAHAIAYARHTGKQWGKALCLCVLSSSFIPAAHSADLNTNRPDFGDYFSTNSTQFDVTGSIRVLMDAATWSDTTSRAAAVADRLRAVEVYLGAVITDKYPDIFQNFSYGNFKSTVRHETMRAVSVTPTATADVYTVDFSVLIAGPRDLTSQTGNPFVFSMPQGAVGSDFGFPLFEIRRFDPATETGPLESVSVNISATTQSPNTYPDYDALLADDTLDITMWAGYDYTEDRVDLWTTVRSWIALFESGFDVFAVDYADTVDAEVEREIRETMARYYPGSLTETTVNLFSRMTRNSGAFSKTVNYKGRLVTINVRLLHRDMFKDDNALMKSTFLDEMASRDVVIYNGHAGPYYGWYLGPESDAFLDVNAVANHPMDASRSQVVVVSGCQTYSTYAEHLYKNPAKNAGNLDVISAVNWIQLSHGERSINNILQFFVADTDSNYRVFSYAELLTAPNSDVFEPDAFWSVVGTADNPVINPLADTNVFSAACSVDADCGTVPQNRCVRGECSVQSLDSYVCPAGYDFIDPFAVWGAYCAPAGCPQFVFDDGQIYIDNAYAPNECSTTLSCPDTYFYGTPGYATAICNNGEWSPEDSSPGGGAVSCPNSVFADGNMYDADRNYVSNQCATDGVECAGIYFYAREAYLTGVCENGAWIDVDSAGDGGDGGDGGNPVAEGCPNGVFDNGFMYDADSRYRENACALDGQVCASAYFYALGAYTSATCSDGIWTP